MLGGFCTAAAGIAGIPPERLERRPNDLWKSTGEPATRRGLGRNSRRHPGKVSGDALLDSLPDGEEIMPTSMLDPIISTPTPAPALTSWAEAYDTYKDLIAAVSDDALLHINVDIASVVTMICGAWPQIAALRPELEKLPGFDPVVFDRVEGLTLALAHTQAMYLGASTPSGTLPARAAEGSRLRELLLDEVRLLSKRGVVDGAFTESLRGGPGYKTIAFELAALVNCLRRVPAAVAARLHVAPEELSAADALARSITQELGLREQAPVVAAAVTRTRSQAFTLVTTSYDQVRRGVAYARWDEGDADTIAPSIYAGRSGRRSAESEDVTGGPVPTPVVSDAPRAPASGGGVAPEATPKPRIPAGYPGSSPFIDEA
jgi:hypothetical protein